jgi:hypothetical protein
MKQLFEKVEIHLVEFRKLFDELIYAGRDMQDRNRLGNSYMPIEMYYEDVCERYLQPIPSPEKVSDLSDEEMVIYFNNHSNGIISNPPTLTGASQPVMPAMTRSAVIEAMKWARDRKPIVNASIPTMEMPSDLYNKIKDILRPYLHNHLEIVSDEIIEAIKESIDNIKNSFASQPPVEEKKETPDRGVVFRTVNEKSVKAQRISHRINCGLIENHGLVLTESQNSFIEAVLNAEFNKQSQPVSPKSAEENMKAGAVLQCHIGFGNQLDGFYDAVINAMEEYKSQPDSKVIDLRSELIKFAKYYFDNMLYNIDQTYEEEVDEYLALKEGSK